MKTNKQRSMGFTLVEMMLVLVIMSGVIGIIINYSTNRMVQFRRDHAAVQMQQILAAGMGYYISHGQWPTSIEKMVTAGYLPATIQTSYGAPQITSTATATLFAVQLTTAQQADAQIIAGELPLAVVAASGSNWTVTGQVSVPGQNLNNARSVNYAGIYANGTCVPAPTCPSTMVATIYVAPVSVSGVNDVPSGCTSSSPSSCSSGSVVTYPLTSFTAYAVPSGSTTASGAVASPPSCVGVSGDSGCPTGTDPAGTVYWRVCLQVVTEKGIVAPSGGSAQEQLMGSIMAVTRCMPNGGDIPNGNGL